MQDATRMISLNTVQCTMCGNQRHYFTSNYMYSNQRVTTTCVHCGRDRQHFAVVAEPRPVKRNLP